MRTQTPRLVALIVLGLLAALAIHRSPAAQEAPRAIFQRIAVIDMERITRESRSIQSTVSRAEGQLTEKRNRLEDLLAEGQRRTARLEERRSVMSEESILAEETRLREMSEEMNLLESQISRDLERIRVSIMDPEVERIIQAVETIAAEENFDIVLRANAVVFSVPAAELTDRVIARLDEGFEEDTGATPTGPPETPAGDE